MKKHQIELSTATIKATLKLFHTVTKSDLEKAGFTELDIADLGELYRDIKDIDEEMELFPDEFQEVA